MYFRTWLGVALREFVTKQHLTDYVHMDVKFIKIDEETYIMDFVPNRGAGLCP